MALLDLQGMDSAPQTGGGGGSSGERPLVPVEPVRPHLRRPLGPERAALPPVITGFCHAVTSTRKLIQAAVPDNWRLSGAAALVRKGTP